MIVGGLNWGLVALAEFDLVAWLVGEDFGQTNAASRIVYGLVGLAAVYGIAQLASRETSTQHRRSSLRLHPGMKGTPMRKLILPVVVLVVALATAAVALGGNDSGSTAQPAAKPTKNIVQTAVAAGDFDTLVSLVKRAGLAKTLSGKGPFTVFAPTDAAFKKVPASTLEALLKDRAALRNVLLYHVAAGRYPAKRVVKQKSIETLAGQRVKVSTRGDTVRVAGAKVVQADVRTSNGVIHAINRVLIPPQ